ncbi:hypothetical protein BC938DRAFT_474844, partial [Jimgerdemannia flammicorona]
MVNISASTAVLPAWMIHGSWSMSWKLNPIHITIPMSLFGNLPALLKPPSDLRFTVGAVLFYDHDVLDLNGPLHFFGGSGQFEIKTIAETKEPVANCGGTHTLVTHTFDEDTEFDFLFIPGAGPRGLLDLSQNERVVAYVKKVAPRMKFIFSVCT